MRTLQNKDEVGFCQSHTGILIPIKAQQLLHAAETTHQLLKLLVSNKLLNHELVEKFTHLSVDEVVALFTKIARHLALTRQEIDEARAAFLASAANSDEASDKARDQLRALIQKSRRRSFDACEAEASKSDPEQTQATIAIPWGQTSEEAKASRLAALQNDCRAGVITPVELGTDFSGYKGEPPLEKLIEGAWTEEYLPKSESYKCVFDRKVLQRIKAISRSINDRESVMRRFLHEALAHGGNRLLPRFSEQTVEAVELLRTDFPNFGQAIDAVINNLWLNLTRTPAEYCFEPLLLNGPPGIGKTTFAEALAKALGVGFTATNVGKISASFVLSGGDASWSSSKPGMLARMLASSASCIGLFLLDEIDKSDNQGRYPILPVLLDMLEPQTARCFTDEFLTAQLDLSQTIFVATSNSISGVSNPLLSRFHVISCKAPSAEQREAVVRSFLRKSLPRFVPEPALITLLATSSSNLRDLRKVVFKISAVAARRHLRSGGLNQGLIPLTTWDANIAGVKPAMRF